MNIGCIIITPRPGETIYRPKQIFVPFGDLICDL